MIVETCEQCLIHGFGDALDAAISAWLHARPTPRPRIMRRKAVAVDGKSPRGTFARTGGAAVHLLAARDRGAGMGQQRVPMGTCEITAFAAPGWTPLTWTVWLSQPMPCTPPAPTGATSSSPA